MDRPADIKRCGLIPFEYSSKKRYKGDDGWYYLEDYEIKRILKKRIDFSKEAIHSLKLESLNNEQTENIIK